MNMEYVGPKRLIDQVFNRPHAGSKKTNNSFDLSSRPATPVRTNSSRTATGVPAADRLVARPTALRSASTRV